MIFVVENYVGVKSGFGEKYDDCVKDDVDVDDGDGAGEPLSLLEADLAIPPCTPLAPATYFYSFYTLTSPPLSCHVGLAQPA